MKLGKPEEETKACHSFVKKKERKKENGYWKNDRNKQVNKIKTSQDF